MTDKTPDPAAPRERTNATFADHQIPMGSGGDTHQMSDGETPGLTTQQAAPVSDDQNISQTLVEQKHLSDALTFVSGRMFVERCRRLRHWPREQAIDQT